MSLTVISGPWTPGQIRDFWSTATIPIRLATAGMPGPTVQSLWFFPQEDTLWCCTQREALVVRRLRTEPYCGFEIAGDHPPYRGVRGHGRAQIEPEAAGRILPLLLERYSIQRESSLAQWLLSRIADEVAIAVTDLAVTSWDYADRMSTAIKSESS